MKTNDSFDECAKSVNLNTRVLDDVVLLEGNADTFRFLSQLFSQMAEAGASSRQFSPNGAGSDIFDPDARIGLYLNCSGDQNS